jgi:hypothetical protein
MSPDGVGFIIIFVSLPIAGFLLFRVAHFSRDLRWLSRPAALAGAAVFVIWLIATVALTISLFSQATTFVRL